MIFEMQWKTSWASDIFVKIRDRVNSVISVLGLNYILYSMEEVQNEV